jgi:hypothetical protein
MSQGTKFSRFGNMAPRIWASLYWEMMTCVLVDRYCCYGGTCCLHVWVWVSRHKFSGILRGVVWGSNHVQIIQPSMQRNITMAPSYYHTAHPTSAHTERENTVQLPAEKAPPDGVSYKQVHFSFDIEIDIETNVNRTGSSKALPCTFHVPNFLFLAWWWPHCWVETSWIV